MLRHLGYSTLEERERTDDPNLTDAPGIDHAPGTCQGEVIRARARLTDNLELAASARARLDHLDLRMDPLTHLRRMADDAHLFPLHRPQTGQGVDHDVQVLGIQRAEALVHKQVGDLDIPGRQGGEAERQPKTDQEGLATRQRGEIAHLVGPVVIDHPDAQRVLHLLQAITLVQQAQLGIRLMNQETECETLCSLPETLSFRIP